MEVNIHHAKTHLSKLIEKALAGEDVTIAKAGKPLVKLIPIEKKKPVLGSAGIIELPDGWDGWTDEEIEEMIGGDIFPPDPVPESEE